MRLMLGVLAGLVLVAAAVGFVVAPVAAIFDGAVSAIWTALKADGASGWAQAVFSVIAIWFAGRFVILEHRNTALRDMESLEGDIRAAKKAIYEVADLIVATTGRIGPLRAYPDTRLEALSQKLSSFPVHQLGSSKAPLLIVKVQEVLIELEACRFGTANNGAHDYASTSEIEIAERSKKSIRKALRKVRRWAQGRRTRRDMWWIW